MNDILLHQWEISPFCGKVRRMLAHKELPFAVRNYNGLRAPLAASLSAVGKLPVLDINGERIQDSRRIATYLEQHFPQRPLLPAKPEQRARVEILQDWADESLYWYNFYFRLNYEDAWDKTARFFAKGRPVWEKQLVKSLGRRPYLKQLQAQGIGRQDRATVEARFNLLLDALETELEQGPWLVTNQKTLADIAVASFLLEIQRTSHLASALRQRTPLQDWMQRVDSAQ